MRFVFICLFCSVVFGSAVFAQGHHARDTVSVMKMTGGATFEGTIQKETEDSIYFRTTDVTGVVTLNPGVEMVMPGDNVSVTAELISPIAMDQGLRFAVREGGKTVGSGVVTEILA